MKAIVLNSGGLDSTVCVGMAVYSYGKENVSTVSVHYGQKHDKELEAAQKIADHYGLKHYVLGLAQIFKHSNCSLLRHSTEEIGHKSYAEQIEEDGSVSTYVPFRNGLMLSAVVSLAGSVYPDEDVEIWIGAHADDAAGNAYADCTFGFMSAIGEAIHLGTYGKIRVRAPFIAKNKAGVVAMGRALEVPFELTWSCYEGGDKACGSCATCLDRIAAFEANSMVDPIEYESQVVCENRL